MKISEMTKEQALEALETEQFNYRGGGVRRNWLEVQAGLRQQPDNVGKRGPDTPTAPRQVARQVSVAQRYFDITGGRSIEQDMASQQAMIQAMASAVDELDDPKDRFRAMEAVHKAQADFNKTWLPYMEQKLGTMQSNTTVEEQKDWDAMLSMPVVGNKDGNN